MTANAAIFFALTLHVIIWWETVVNKAFLNININKQNKITIK